MNNNDNKGKIISIRIPGSTPYDAAEERERNIIGARIAQARKQAGMSLVTFSEYISQFGVQIGSRGLSKWETGDSVPSAYQLIAISNALGLQDGIHYFMDEYETPMNDIGMKKLTDYRSDLIATGRYRPVPRVTDVIPMREMPIHMAKVSAGPGNFLNESNFEMREFPTDAVPSDAEFGILVSGDSMEPIYNDGQIVWVQRRNRLNVGEVGIFVYDGEGYLKMYSEQEPEEAVEDAFTDSNGVVRKQPVLVSYNKKYEPKVISPYAYFQIIGRVLR